MRAITILLLLLPISSVQAGELEDRITRLIPVLIEQESNGDTWAIGDNGNALGCMQIWPDYIKDVNAAYGTTYDQVHVLGDKNTSCEITYLYLLHYGKVYKKMTGAMPTIIDLARIHNGGPTGYARKATRKYGREVMLRLITIKEEK